MAVAATFLTNSVTKLELLCNEDQLSIATGFFYKHCGSWFLITNWHALSGRNPNTGQPMHLSGAVPTHCRFYVTSLQEMTIAWTAVTYALGDPYEQSVTWYQHPAVGQLYDVAALPIDAVHVGLGKDILDPTGNDPSMLIDLGSEIFLPGYPLGLTATGYMPLWKRASLASSLEFGEGIDRYFLVDTATREGMSGAPCIAIANWRYYSLDRATNKVRVVERPMSWRLLGVYSGRLNPSNSFEAQIGIVWRLNLVEEVVASQTAGTVALASNG